MLRPLFVVALTAAAIVAVTLLVDRVDSSRQAQLRIGALTQTVTNLGSLPFSADPAFNPSPGARSPRLATTVAGEVSSDKIKLSDGLSAAAQSGAPAAIVSSARARLAEVAPAVTVVFGLATRPGGLDAAGAAKVAAAQAMLGVRLAFVTAALGRLDLADGARARRARTQAEAGTALAMLLLLVVFGFFYFRSERLARENDELLGQSREEASTDALTGLGNRRALTNALSGVLARQAPGAEELLLAVFDLDGFKQYNDTFGHAAGDALLARLGVRLTAAALGAGSAYRMGGDEFCMLARSSPGSAETLLERAVSALSDSGEGWHISCSQGAVWMPSEAASASQAVQIADERMYANKTLRSSASQQIADVLLQVLNEQDNDLDVHGDNVAELSREVAVAMHLPTNEIRSIRLAATLHDIGKTAIPESVLCKPGPLDEREWEFMHRHTLIGERIVLAAPALASTAPLIRSSHERLDGAGYPDGLRGEQIPIGSRIIAVCDAFDAMTSQRSYRAAGTIPEALSELRRCAGSQFDLGVVDAICEVALSREAGSAPLPTAA